MNNVFHILGYCFIDFFNVFDRLKWKFDRRFVNSEGRCKLQLRLHNLTCNHCASIFVTLMKLLLFLMKSRFESNRFRVVFVEIHQCKWPILTYTVFRCKLFSLDSIRVFWMHFSSIASKGNFHLNSKVNW